MHPFACPLCQSLPVNATVIASCLHVFCKNCLKQYQNKARHADICPECGCKYKRTKRTPEYEIKLREAFPEEYENRKDFLQVKLNSVDELDFLNERIARLSWLRTKLFKRVREDGDISKQAEEYFGTKRKYNIIYADPPWNYLNQIFNGSIKDKYDQMTDKDIHALPVEGLCHENAALFLWTTMPKIKVALEVIESWGFSYTTCFAAWSKIYPKTGEVKCGAGSYTRPNTELVLLGLKGDISKYRARNQCISNAFIPCPEKNPLLQDPLEGNTNRLLEDHPKIEDEFFDSIKKSRILVTPYVEKHSQKPLQIAVRNRLI